MVNLRRYHFILSFMILYCLCDHQVNAEPVWLISMNMCYEKILSFIAFFYSRSLEWIKYVTLLLYFSWRS